MNNNFNGDHTADSKYTDEFETEGMEYEPSDQEAVDNGYHAINNNDHHHSARGDKHQYGQHPSQSYQPQSSNGVGISNNGHSTSQPAYTTQKQGNKNDGTDGKNTLDYENLYKQMVEKVRNQAERLLNLEKYKIICEKRIQDIWPEHPLPVLTSHLGVKPNLDSGLTQQISELQNVIALKDQEIQQYKKKNSVLSSRKTSPYTQNKGSLGAINPDAIAQNTSPQQQNLYHNELLKEKSQLEQSLRSETLANEEQRNYIEILKQALDAKIEDLGFTEILNQARKGEIGSTNIDLFAEMSNLKIQSDYHRKENMRTQSTITDLEMQVSRLRGRQEEMRHKIMDLDEAKMRAVNDLQSGISVIDKLKDEKNKLNEEKNALLDYVEELMDKQKTVLYEIEQLKSNIQKVENSNNEQRLLNEKLKVEGEKLENTKAELENTLDQAINREKDMANECDKLNQDLNDLNNVLSNKVRQIDTLKDEAHKNEEMIKSLSDNNESLRKNISDNENAHNEREKELSSKGQEYHKLFEDEAAKFNKASKQLKESKMKNKNLQNNYVALTGTLQDTQNELDQLIEFQKEITDNNRRLENDSINIQGELRSRDETISKLTSNIENMENDMNSMREEYSNKLDNTQKALLHTENLMNDNVMRLDNTLNSKNNELKSMYEQSLQNKNEIKALKECVLHEKKQNIELKDENEGMKRALDDKEENLEMLTNELEISYKNQEAMQKDIDKYRADNQKMYDDIQQNNKTIKNLENSLKDIKLDKEKKDSIINDLNAEMSKRHMDAENLSIENDKLVKNINQSEAHIKDLSKKIMQIETQLDEQVQQCCKYVEQIDQLSVECDKLNFEKNCVLEEHDRFKHENEELLRDLQDHQNDFGRLGKNVSTIVSNISGFLSALPNVSKSLLSRKFKDSLYSFTSRNSTIEDLINRIGECVENAFTELEAALNNLNEVEKEKNGQREKFLNYETKLSGLINEEACYKEKERYLKNEINNLTEEKHQYEKEKELFNKREQKLESENNALRSENRAMKHQHEAANAQLKSALYEKDLLTRENRAEIDKLSSELLNVDTQLNMTKKRENLLDSENKKIENAWEKRYTQAKYENDLLKEQLESSNRTKNELLSAYTAVSDEKRFLEREVVSIKSATGGYHRKNYTAPFSDFSYGSVGNLMRTSTDNYSVDRRNMTIPDIVITPRSQTDHQYTNTPRTVINDDSKTSARYGTVSYDDNNNTRIGDTSLTYGDSGNNEWKDKLNKLKAKYSVGRR